MLVEPDWRNGQRDLQALAKSLGLATRSYLLGRLLASVKSISCGPRTCLCIRPDGRPEFRFQFSRQRRWNVRV